MLRIENHCLVVNLNKLLIYQYVQTHVSPKTASHLLIRYTDFRPSKATILVKD